MSPKHLTTGPFKAHYLRSGDPYELSNGHPIYCAPASAYLARFYSIGGLVLDTDPDVGWVGINAGITTEPGMLRAPNIVVRATAPEEEGNVWLTEAPPLAVEYAAEGQDMDDLQCKLAELLQAGTGWIWVVHLTDPRRVEVHRLRQPVQVYWPGQFLEAPGLLKNPVPVEALYDREVAHGVALRNLLQRRGYDSLEAVYAEGETKGRLGSRIP
ncbi:hypothetical protein CCP4SC76_3690025 [Gammaproteobacteria bacterium]